MGKVIALPVWVAALGLAVLTAMGLGDRLALGGVAGLVFEYPAHLPKHLALAAFAVAAAAGALRMWKATGLAGAAAAINLALVLGVSFATPERVPEGAPVLRIVSGNVHGSREALTRLSELAKSYQADLVAVFEAPDISEEGMAALFPEFPLRRKATHSPDGQLLSKAMMFAVRAPSVGQIAMMPYGSRNRAILRFKVPVGDAQARIVMTHPVAPDANGRVEERDLLLSHTGDGLVETEPFVVLGDFNTTPWGHAYGLLPGKRAGDPRFAGTFPAGLGIFGVPIDHVMFGGGLKLVEHRVGPNIGSDHLPLLTTFAGGD